MAEYTRKGIAMFYPHYCKTDVQKAVFDALMELSSGGFVTVQELDYLGLPPHEISETLKYFESRGLLENVQHLGREYPVIFSVKD